MIILLVIVAWVVGYQVGESNGRYRQLLEDEKRHGVGGIGR